MKWRLPPATTGLVTYLHNFQTHSHLDVCLGFGQDSHMHDDYKTFINLIYTEINFLMAKVMTYLDFNLASMKPRIFA